MRRHQVHQDALILRERGHACPQYIRSILRIHSHIVRLHGSSFPLHALRMTLTSDADSMTHTTPSSTPDDGLPDGNRNTAYIRMFSTATRSIDTVNPTTLLLSYITRITGSEQHGSASPLQRPCFPPPPPLWFSSSPSYTIDAHDTYLGFLSPGPIYRSRRKCASTQGETFVLIPHLAFATLYITAATDSMYYIYHPPPPPPRRGPRIPWTSNGGRKAAGPARGQARRGHSRRGPRRMFSADPHARMRLCRVWARNLAA